MQVKKAVLSEDDEEKTGFIKWFSELNKSSGAIAGGKGANLAEIYNLKISVPPGFVITAQSYDYFIKSAGLDQRIKNLLEKIDYEDTEQLDNVTKEIREMIERAEFPENLREEIIDSYETLSAEDSKTRNKPANELIGKSQDFPFVAVRSSATAEDLAEASFAGQQESFLNVRGDSDLLLHIKKCFASLFTSRAAYYRNKKGFKHIQVSLAVVVQKMIDSDKSGVIFSKDPSTKRNNVIIEAVWGLGEGIVSGQITPDRYIVSQKESGEFEIIEKEITKKKIAIVRGPNGGKETIKLKEERSEQQVLKEHEVVMLSEIAIKLEDHYKKPQDIEFAIASDKIYIVQTRPITTMESRGDISSEKELNGEVVLTGLAASPGIGFGKIKIVLSLNDLNKIEKGDILVTKMTDPDMVVTMQKCAAIVTDEGGLTAHAAIVSREMGIPAIVGTQEATTKLKDGEMMTVDGFTGKVYRGKVSEFVQKEIKPVVSKTRTKIKVMVDLPSFASRAAKTGIKEVGLARIEGIIAESGKHPLYFVKKNKIKDYEELIFKGLNEIAEHFEEIWVRTSDIRSDEFQHLEGAPEKVEANPMLGMHGIRFSLKNPDILRAELRAMKRVSKQGRKIGVMAPQIISVEEVRSLKKFLKETNFPEAKVGIMVETSAAVQLIEDFCEEGIEFISFGTNDLTQYTLAVDRGNEEVQDLYDEMHPAVLRQMAYVIKTCKEKGVETSICGQAGSKKEMAKFLVQTGIDSISVNADVASEIAEYVAEIEGIINNKSEEEPSHNQSNKTNTLKHENHHSKEFHKEPAKESYDEFVNAAIKEEIISEVRINANKKQFEPEELPVINGAKEIQRIQEESGEDEILDIF
ncbi:MAG: phosphoenolpyruvate synthase [Nanoarchaeota archaeon]